MKGLINAWEKVILVWAGKIIMAIGGGGLFLTIYFDQIARGEDTTTWGWLQILGVVVFISFLLFGVVVDKCLNDLKEFLGSW